MLKQTREPHTENFIGLTENGKISIEDRKFGSYVILPTEINTKTNYPDYRFHNLSNETDSPVPLMKISRLIFYQGHI